jgi:hypothetical protein
LGSGVDVLLVVPGGESIFAPIFAPCPLPGSPWQPVKRLEPHWITPRTSPSLLICSAAPPNQAPACWSFRLPGLFLTGDEETTPWS